MPRNIAVIGRRELIAHRRFVTGVTASVPIYKLVNGSDEWTVDVYIGPLEQVEQNVLKDVPIAAVARNLVSDLRLPVLLERSKQGQYTVIGRSKTMPAGAQTPDGSIFEPTYHRITYNLAELGLTFLADLDFELSPYQDGPDDEWQNDPDEPFQTVKVFDAFGKQVAGPGAEVTVPKLEPDPKTVTTTRHVKIEEACWGNFGWGTSEIFQPTIQTTIELVE